MFLLPLDEVDFQRILNGEKLFDFRKKIPAELICGDELAICVRKPKCGIVAYAKVAWAFEDTPSRMWERTRYAAGMGETAFTAFFGKARKAYAIAIGKIGQLKKPIDLDFDPKPFAVLTNTQAKKIRACANKASSRGVTMFVGGVHGVGKTTVCKTALDGLGFDYTSMSELIRRHVESKVRGKRVRKIEENCKILVQESDREKARRLLNGLDGHYCLQQKDRTLKCLPVELFKDLGIDLFVLVEAPIDIVVRHLQMRDGTKWTKKEVGAMMRAERAQAKRIAKALNKPLVVIDSQKKDCVEKVVAGLEKVLETRRTVACYKDPRLR